VFAVERRDPEPNVAGNLNRHASLHDRPTGCAEALTDLERLCDDKITEMKIHNVPVARNCALLVDPSPIDFAGILNQLVD
jgi:hypothetical protein